MEDEILDFGDNIAIITFDFIEGKHNLSKS